MTTVTTKPLNYKNPTFSEGMVIANQAGKDATTVLKEFIKNDPRWVSVLGYAMNPRLKSVLPEGVPPYKESEFQEGVSFTSVLDAHKTMALFYNKEANKMKVEEAFIKHLEVMTADDAKHFVAIKDKNLHTLYENITEEVLVNALGWNQAEYQEMKKNYS